MPSLEPVDFDPFASAPAMGSGPLRIRVTPGNSRLEPVDHDPFAAASSGPGYVEDTIKSFGSGIARGGTALLGMPGTIGELYNQGANAALEYIATNWAGMSPEMIAETKAAIKLGRQYGAMRDLPTGEDVQRGLESVTGPLYKPQTEPGRYAETIGEFIPGGGRKVLSLAVAPGLASEYLGQKFEGSAAEPYVRAGAAVATGGGMAALSRPRTAERAIRDALPASVTPQVVDQAAALMDSAAVRGINLTWAEALEQVAPGTGLVNMQRILESSPGSRQTMGQFFSDRPQQIETAVRQQLGPIAARPAQPSAIGPAVGRAADEEIDATRQAINAASEPFYGAAERVTLSPSEMARVRSLPGYPEARDAVQNDPQLARYVRGLPENSVGFLNEVKKYLDQSATNARAPMAQNPNMQRAAGYGQDAEAVRRAGMNASPDYATALQMQTQMREQYLQPLLEGPLGKIADRIPETGKAIDALFPSNPLPNSQLEIRDAIGALVRRNTWAARQLVRAHAESTFNEAARLLQGGGNQMVGAAYVKAIVGNPQQRVNLRAAVEALPDGDRIWAGFNRFLDVLQATGTRQGIGSRTAFNAQELKDMMSGSMIGNAAKTATAPGKWLNVVSDAWSRWQLGRNLDQLANILTDPRSVRTFREIASQPAGSRQAQVLAARLVLMVAQVSANKTGNANDR
jgi:hypothetical protein